MDEINLEEKEYFNRNYNISYYDESLPKPPVKLIFMHYISSALIYSVAVMLMIFNPFYIDIMKKISHSYEILFYVYLSYLLIAPIILFTFKPKTIYASQSIEILNYFAKLIKREGLQTKFSSTEFLEWLKPTYKQQQSMILYFIKFFFAPQIILLSITHLQAFYKELSKTFDIIAYTIQSGYDLNFIIKSSKLLVEYRDAIYITLFQLLYFFDCYIFAIGYCTELTLFNNKIRTVDASPLGLFFCLACYEPFSKATTQFIQWKHSELTMNITSNPIELINWIYYTIAITLIALYVSASIALFTKAGNLTNRGTCKSFPYNIVRHPAYSTKIILWWISSTIIIKSFISSDTEFLKILLYILSGITWTFIYYMRAITEERHLSLDPEYRAYVKEVKYKFIPYLW